MPHSVFNMGDQPVAVTGFFRQLVAGQAPAEAMVIGRSRARRSAILLLDAWIEVNNFAHSAGGLGLHQMKYSLALSNNRPPTAASLLLPVGRVSFSLLDAGAGATDQPITGVSPHVEQLFKAHGTVWVAQWIGVRIEESGFVGLADVDLHLDWTGTSIDWWDWFVKWNQLEESPDGSLVDGERQYA